MSRCATPPYTATIPMHCPSPLPAFRNLGGELAGVIFTCTEDSLDDCLRAGVFGLPRTHFQYVQHVRPSMVLFLFNFSTRELHGIFRAITGGKLDTDLPGVNPDWAAKFPAQVHVDTSDTYPPLPESTFRRFISENYMSANSSQFSFELDMEQVARLSEAFKHYAVNRGTPIPHQNILPPMPSASPTPNPIVDRPQPWYNDRTKRMSPVGIGRRPAMDFLNLNRPRSSMDYRGTFDSDFGFLGNPAMQPRMSVDIQSMSNNQLNALGSLLGNNPNAPSPLLGNDPYSALTGGSGIFPGDATGWNSGDTLAEIMSQLGGQTQSLLHPGNLGLHQEGQSKGGRLSPGHLPQPEGTGESWNAEATMNAFQLAAQRLTPDIQLPQAAASNISADERGRSIWQVNSQDMGLVGADQLLFKNSALPEISRTSTDINLTLKEQQRIDAMDQGWVRQGNSALKPPRPHSSTDCEVQGLTSNFWNYSDKQLGSFPDVTEINQRKNSKNRSAGKGLGKKDSQEDDNENSEESETEPDETVQDRVNIGMLEWDSTMELNRQNGGQTEYGDYYQMRDNFSGQKNGKEMLMADSLPSDPNMGMSVNSANHVGMDYGVDMSGQEGAAFEELSRLRLENEQLKMERNQLQKQLNNAMKKRSIDITAPSIAQSESPSFTQFIV